MPFVSDLKLQNFRNYKSCHIKNLEKGFTILYGPNGAGKTNILEALSFLSPGRGLRNSKVTDIQNQDFEPHWVVSASVGPLDESCRIGTGLDSQSGKKRIIKINGAFAKSQAELNAYLSIFWLTPQMDSLFIGSSGERRRFYDRMIFAFDPAHNGRLIRYEKAMSQRSKLLKDSDANDAQKNESWLDSLEIQMAETGVALAATRVDFQSRLQKSLDQFDHPDFPPTTIHLSGFLEDQLCQYPALELEARFKDALEASRQADMLTGGAAVGPHRTDFMMIKNDSKIHANQCSTGEQKIILVGLVLGHAQLVVAEREIPPLILLDEISAHLDDRRRNSLFSILHDLGSQTWLTGTDQSLFGGLQARYIKIKAGAVEE